jgi:hypothetical protein
MQPDRKLRCRSTMKFETVFVFLKRGQWPAISRAEVRPPKCAIGYAFLVAEIMAAGTDAPENRPVGAQYFVELFNIEEVSDEMRSRLECEWRSQAVVGLRSCLP